MKANVKCTNICHSRIDRNDATCGDCKGTMEVETEVFTKAQIDGLLELIQDDLICFLDGFPEEVVSRACGLIVKRKEQLLNNEF